MSEKQQQISDSRVGATTSLPWIPSRPDSLALSVNENHFEASRHEQQEHQVHFTDEDLKLLVAWATWRTLRSLGIVTEDEPYAPADAVEMLSASKGHHDALAEFAAAYVAWYEFHLEIYKAGKSGNLSASESDTLHALIQRRDDARKALVELTAE